MKRLLSLSLFLMAVMLSFAHDFESGGIYYNITSSSAPYTVAVSYRGISYSEYSNEYIGDVNIPSSVNYDGKVYSVTTIGYDAFRNCTGLTSVTIPNSVTSINNYAFYGCSGLKSVTIGNRVTAIGYNAFYGCSGLTSVTIPNSVTSIGEDAFRDCSGLKKVIVPDIAAWCNISFGSYDANPLYNAGHIYSDENTEITDLEIPNSVTSIGYQAFLNCSGLTSITIPNSVTTIGYSAFEGCSGLTSVTIGNSVTFIGADAFCDCSGLTSVTIPNSVKSIGGYAFDGCSGLTSVTINSNSIISKPYSSESNLSRIFGSQVKSYIIGDGVTAIGNNAFAFCRGLTSITIPNSVTSIGDYAFLYCDGLTSVTIGNSVTSIGTEAFRLCSSLTSVTIPNSVTSISGSVFSGCSGLKSVTIPNSVTWIGSRAFYGCSGLASITIPNSVTSIGSSAFSGCSSLTSITIPNSVTIIGSDAFYYCSGLKKVIVPDIAAWCKITFGSDDANPLYCAEHIYSDENTEITDLVIPNGVTSIGNYAFYNCSSLTSVTIPNSVTSIGSKAFYGTAWYDNQPNGLIYAGKVAYEYKGTMPANTAIVLEEGTTEIADGAFRDCSGLTSITIPNSVTSIGSRAFYGCSGLTSVTIGNSVTSIGKYAFKGCSGLTSINIPNSVTRIGDDAFDGCSGLKKVIVPDIAAWCNISFGSGYGNPLYYAKHIFSDENTEITDLVIPNSVTSIGSIAFWYCSGLTSITIPYSVTSISDCAFFGCSGLTSVTIPNSVTSIGYDAFDGCSGLTKVIVPDIAAWCKITFGSDNANPLYCAKHIYSDENTEITDLVIPNSVTRIGSSAFSGCIGLTSVTIPNSVTSIGNYAFEYCSGLKEITSYIQEPFQIGDYCWEGVDKSIPLYVPAGTKKKYKITNYWNEFTNIIEFGGERIEPATEAQEVDVAVVPDQISLNGMVVGNTYYVLDAENGDGADSENGCVVINTTTTEEAMNGITGKDISDASVKAVFKGIIFMVPAGTGTVSINAETLGTSSLMVKIGSQPAQAFQLAERETVEIPYSVAEPTYVYIYAGTGTQAARSVGAARAVAAENSVKVYSYKWEPADPTGISSVDNSQSATGNEAGDWYTIDGRKLSGKPAQKGIYIVKGRKVAVK